MRVLFRWGQLVEASGPGTVFWCLFLVHQAPRAVMWCIMGKPSLKRFCNAQKNALRSPHRCAVLSHPWPLHICWVCVSQPLIVYDELERRGSQLLHSERWGLCKSSGFMRVDDSLFRSFYWWHVDSSGLWICVWFLFCSEMKFCKFFNLLTFRCVLLAGVFFFFPSPFCALLCKIREVWYLVLFVSFEICRIYPEMTLHRGWKLRSSMAVLVFKKIRSEWSTRLDSNRTR